MWANDKTFINVTFDSSSRGQLSMVIYEWGDSQYLGKVTQPDDDYEYIPKTYICTTNAQASGFCKTEDLGKFILDLPTGMTINDTSFWNARVELSEQSKPAPPSGDSLSANGLWDNPDGNPTPPPSNYTSPWRARQNTIRSSKTSGFWDNPAGNPTPPYSPYASPWKKRADPAAGLNPSPNGLLVYQDTIQYQVRKTGYYCVAIVPVTVERVGRQDTGPHPEYKGEVLFQNKFDGALPATDYPKVNFYFAMFLVYTAAAAAWGWLCWRHMSELLPIQYYLSGLMALLVIEMAANWVYYRYLNAHGENTSALVFLFVVSILDSGRNAMSFFMLLVVSLGLSVVRESLERTMLKCQLLAGAHFVFGVLYAIGIVELELESTSALILLMFVIPLAFTLSGFLLWIMFALNATITELRNRKQHYKLSMFRRLHWILQFTVLVIAAFFVVSSLSFSGRMAEDYAANSWKVRWWLLDGWLALLYLVAFSAIAFLWRPSEHNIRLSMSDELAQDEADADDYDPEALELRTRNHGPDDDDDDATLVGGRRGGAAPLPSDEVVFEIGDDDDEGDATPKKRRSEQSPRDGLVGNGSNGHAPGRRHDPSDAEDDYEMQGLMKSRDD